MTNPDILIYLDVSHENTILRRKLDWTVQEYEEQLTRLRHARQSADFYLDTNPLNQGQVLEEALAYLEQTTRQVGLSE